MNEKLLRDSLERHEGKRYRPYKDTMGNITIGIGRNLTANGLGEDEINYLFDNDIRNAKLDCATTFSWYTTLDDVRQRVIIELCFNLGLPKLLKFHKMLVYIGMKDYDKASTELADSIWAKQVSIERASRLIGMLKTGKDR